MHAHGHTACQAGVLQIIADAQLIQGMAALVEDGVHRGCHIVQVVVRGDADILVVELQRERMLRLTKTAVAAVQAHHLHQEISKGFLLFHRVFQVQEAVVRLRFFPNRPDQRHQPLAQGAKKDIQPGGVHPPLILVEQRIIRGLGSIVIGCKFPVVLHQLLQHRAERSKIVFFLGLVPDIAGAVGQLCIGHILPGRDAGHPLPAAVQLLHLPPVQGVQLRFPAVQFFQQSGGLRAGHPLLPFPGQDAQGHAPAFGCVAGRSGLRVQIQAVLSAGVCIQLFLQRFQPSQLFMQFHGSFSFFEKTLPYQKNLRRGSGSGSGISNRYRSVALITVVLPWLHTRGSLAS